MDPIHLIDVLDRGGGTGKLHGPVDHEELGEVRLDDTRYVIIYSKLISNVAVRRHCFLILATPQSTTIIVPSSRGTTTTS